VELFARAFAQLGRTRGGLEWYRAFRKDHASALIWKREPLASENMPAWRYQRFWATRLSGSPRLARLRPNRIRTQRSIPR
jgi:hypothetical protein